MSKFIPTKHNNPCPICGDTKGKCRSFDDNESILCMTGAGGLIDRVNGYKYQKDSKDGSWGVFFPDESENNFNREKWLKEKAEAERLKQETLRKEALPENKRHRHYAKISQHLGLSTQHRQELIRRGLTESQIKKLNSFTVEGVTYLPDSTPPNLPSVRVSQIGEKYFSAYNPPDEDNNKPTPSRAYFCPAFNFEGKIIGGQFRHNREDNKYTWLSGLKKNNLPNGEIPITIVRAEDVTNVKFPLDTSKFGKEIKPLGVLEGLFKPYISTCKWGIDSIGASGFNFRNSHNQVREYVKKGGYNLAIFPLDANVVNNPQLLRRLAENIYLFQSLGCQIAILWWGQISKNDLDFDELENLDNVQLLTIDEFLILEAQWEKSSQKSKVKSQKLDNKGEISSQKSKAKSQKLNSSQKSKAKSQKSEDKEENEGKSKRIADNEQNQGNGQQQKATGEYANSIEELDTTNSQDNITQPSPNLPISQSPHQSDENHVTNNGESIEGKCLNGLDEYHTDNSPDNHTQQSLNQPIFPSPHQSNKNGVTNNGEKIEAEYLNETDEYIATNSPDNSTKLSTYLSIYQSPNHSSVVNQDEIDPIHGKVIASGDEALARAKKEIEGVDISEYRTMSLEEFKIALDDKEFSEFEEKFIRQFNQLSKRREKGFSTEFIRIPKFATKNIHYNPDSFYLTIAEDFSTDKQLIIPRKYSQDHHKIKIINHLRKIGVKNVFLNWQTGEGKSHTVSKLNRIIYLDNNYKNPSIPELQNVPYLTPRTYYGLYLVNGKIVADPDETTRKKAEDNNYPQISKLAEGNCILKPAFRTLQNKGYHAEENNLPCDKCQFQKNCTFIEGKFKRETRDDITEIINYGQGRMHYSQLNGKKLERLLDFALIWEEIGNLSTIHDYNFSSNDIKDLVFKLSQNDVIDSDKTQQLIKVLGYLESLTNSNIAKTFSDSQGKYYGLTHEQIIEKMPPIPELNPNEYIQLIEYLIPDIDLPDTNYQIDKLNQTEYKKWGSLKRNAEKYMREELRKELQEKLDNLPFNPVLLLDTIFAMNKNNILSTQKIETKKSQYWTLGVTTPNYHHSEMAKQAQFNLFLDATATETQVKAIFNIENEPLITVTTEKRTLDNLNVFNINLSGLGSNNWTENGLEQVKTGIELIREENKKLNLAVMCPKKYAKELNTDFWYGKSDRGTNELMNYDGIIFVGTPYINVGAVQREYSILFSHRENKPTFEEFYNQKIYELRMQGLGRSRSQHFKNKQLHQFYLTSGEDLSYLKETGCNYKQIEGAMLSPDLAKKGDRTRLRIQTTIFSLFQAGVKITCQAVGDVLGMTRQAVSKAVKTEFNYTWQEFISCQLFLIKSYKEKVDKKGLNFTEDNSYVAYLLETDQTYILKVCIDIIREEGISGFVNCLIKYKTPFHIACRVFWLLSGLFDERLPQLLLRYMET